MRGRVEVEKGGFSSSLDADSEGVEGKFFVWSKAEIDQLLGDDAAAFCAVYGVEAGGNCPLPRLETPLLTFSQR